MGRRGEGRTGGSAALVVVVVRVWVEELAGRGRGRVGERGGPGRRGAVIVGVVALLLLVVVWVAVWASRAGRAVAAGRGGAVVVRRGVLLVGGGGGAALVRVVEVGRDWTVRARVGGRVRMGELRVVVVVMVREVGRRVGGGDRGLHQGLVPRGVVAEVVQGKGLSKGVGWARRGEDGVRLRGRMLRASRDVARANQIGSSLPCSGLVQLTTPHRLTASTSAHTATSSMSQAPPSVAPSGEDAILHHIDAQPRPLSDLASVSLDDAYEVDLTVHEILRGGYSRVSTRPLILPRPALPHELTPLPPGRAPVRRRAAPRRRRRLPRPAQPLASRQGALRPRRHDLRQVRPRPRSLPPPLRATSAHLEPPLLQLLRRRGCSTTRRRRLCHPLRPHLPLAVRLVPPSSSLSRARSAHSPPTPRSTARLPVLYVLTKRSIDPDAAANALASTSRDSLADEPPKAVVLLYDVAYAHKARASRLLSPYIPPTCTR